MKRILACAAAALMVTGCTVSSPQPYGAAQPYGAPPPPPRSQVGDNCGDLGWGKLAGGALGGAAGGLVASNIVRGSGSGIATAAGVIGGMLLGGMAGSNVDKVNCATARSAQQQALQPSTPIGQTIVWNDPQSGASGSFTPTRESRSRTGGYCREFRQTIVVDGQEKQGVGQACQQADGSWKPVS